MNAPRPNVSFHACLFPVFMSFFSYSDEMSSVMSTPLRASNDAQSVCVGQISSKLPLVFGQMKWSRCRVCTPLHARTAINPNFTSTVDFKSNRVSTIVIDTKLSNFYFLKLNRVRIANNKWCTWSYKFASQHQTSCARVRWRETEEQERQKDE